MNWLNPASVGASFKKLAAHWGFAMRLFVKLLLTGKETAKRFRLVLDQMFFLGNKSLSIIIISGLFVGFVLSLQGEYILGRFGSSGMLGLVVALGLIRELGPVFGALLFAGRAGTALTAEIGLMRAGEQLAAMEMMAVNPIERILAPRFWAGVIVFPILTTIFNAVGILGGWFVGVVLMGVDASAFWSQMQDGVSIGSDIGNGLIKSFVFGLAVTFIALLYGYLSKPTPEGVSQATTKTVVSASIVVLALDFLLTAIMFTL